MYILSVEMTKYLHTAETGSDMYLRTIIAQQVNNTRIKQQKFDFGHRSLA